MFLQLRLTWNTIKDGEVKLPFTQTMWKRKLDGPNFSKNVVRIEGRKARMPKVYIYPTYSGIQKVLFEWRLTSATHLWHQRWDRRATFQNKNDHRWFYSFHKGREETNTDRTKQCHSIYREIRLCPHCAAKLIIHTLLTILNIHMLT